jgi:hypothetical protein
MAGKLIPRRIIELDLEAAESTHAHSSYRRTGTRATDQISHDDVGRIYESKVVVGAGRPSKQSRKVKGTLTG